MVVLDEEVVSDEDLEVVLDLDQTEDEIEVEDHLEVIEIEILLHQIEMQEYQDLAEKEPKEHHVLKELFLQKEHLMLDVCHIHLEKEVVHLETGEQVVLDEDPAVLTGQAEEEKEHQDFLIEHHAKDDQDLREKEVVHLETGEQVVLDDHLVVLMEQVDEEKENLFLLTGDQKDHLQNLLCKILSQIQNQKEGIIEEESKIKKLYHIGRVF